MLQDILGLGPGELNVWNMVIRAVVVYVAALFMVRLGEKRFMGKNTAFDMVLGIIFGSVISRAITGSSPFFPTLAAALVLVLLHWLFSTLSFYTDWFGTLVKGHNRVLVKGGEIQWDAMRQSHISEKDLMSALRSEAHVARLERSGDISVIKASSEPKVVEVRVEQGVQTVRIKMEV
jgi:uncharacterized membrane protein YcaP (DUF421 family)